MYLDLVNYTKEPELLNTLDNDILLYIFEKHSAINEEKAKNNPCYSLDRGIIERCNTRVQRLYMQWLCDNL